MLFVLRNTKLLCINLLKIVLFVDDNALETQQKSPFLTYLCLCSERLHTAAALAYSCCLAEFTVYFFFSLFLFDSLFNGDRI